MHNTIFKKADNISKEEILKVCEFEEIPEYGDVFNYDKFMDAIKSYCITDYDG